VGEKPGLRFERQATNRLSHGTAIILSFVYTGRFSRYDESYVQFTFNKASVRLTEVFEDHIKGTK
jgi:hypothetical protein